MQPVSQKESRLRFFWCGRYGSATFNTAGLHRDSDLASRYFIISLTKNHSACQNASAATYLLFYPVIRYGENGVSYSRQTSICAYSSCCRLLFHGFIRLWLWNSGLCPSNSLATTANFISWNDAIAADGLLMSLPACIILNRKIAVLLSNDSYDIIKKIFQSMSILLNPFCIYN